LRLSDLRLSDSRLDRLCFNLLHCGLLRCGLLYCGRLKFTVIVPQRQRLVLVERGAKSNALLLQGASHGGVADAELCGDVAATFSLAIELDNSNSQRWRSNGFRSAFFREQASDSALPKLASQAGEVARVKFQGAANLFDFSDACLDQLDGAKAVQDLIVERKTKEGRLVDENGAQTIQIAKPNASIDRYGILGKRQVVDELRFSL
jgi:hypothetical protein